MRPARVDPQRSQDLAERLLTVQHRAYRVEADLLGDDRIPPLHETVTQLQRAGLNWIAALDDSGHPTGAIAWTETVDHVDIDRLVVDPRVHRRGVGSALLVTLLSHASGRRTGVSTGRENSPAIRLYLQHGFERGDDREVLPGLWVTHLVHDG